MSTFLMDSAKEFTKASKFLSEFIRKSPWCKCTDGLSEAMQFALKNQDSASCLIFFEEI